MCAGADMSNLIIGRAEYSDQATLSAGNERSGFAVANLQKQQVSRIWKSNGLSSVYFVVDRSFAAAWNTVSLMYVNATKDATWRIRAADTEAALTDGSATYDSGTLTFWAETDMKSWALRHGLLFLTTAQTTRYVRIDLTDTGNSSDLTAGRLIIGNFWQPTINMEYPLQYGPGDEARIERSQGGALFADQRDTYNKATVRLNFLDEDEMLNNAFDLRRHGKAADLLIVLNPASTTHLAKQMIYGLVTRNQPIVHPAFGVYSHVITVAEMATIARVDPVEAALITADFAAGDIDLLTLTRATVGFTVNSSGLLVSKAIDAARLTHTTEAFTSLGLLAEPAQTNHRTDSHVLAASGNVTVTANNAVAPDGATTAATIYQTAATGRHFAGNAFGITNIVNGSKYTGSIYVKDDGGTLPTFALYAYSGPFAKAGSDFFGIMWDFATETLEPYKSGSTSIEVGFERLANGWYRLWFTQTATGTSGTSGFTLEYTDGFRGTTSFAGSTSIGIAIWGQQVELVTGDAVPPSSIVITSGSEVTRALDLATIDLSSVSVFSATGFAIVFSARLRDLNGILMAVGVGSTDEIALDMQAGVLHLTGADSLDLTAASGLSVGDDIKVALRVQDDDVAVSVDGATVVTSSSHTMNGGADEMQLGQDVSGANGAHVTVSKVVFYNTPLPTNAELETLSSA